jgi:hypothetical protein
VSEAITTPWAPLNGDEGFYVTFKRDSRTGTLLGPFSTHETALLYVDTGREMAIEVDPMAAFDEFGTARARRGPSARPFPPGKLNARWEERYGQVQPG